MRSYAGHRIEQKGRTVTTDEFVDPTREAFTIFKALPRDTEIHMLNLLRFRQQARYPSGHDQASSGLTGEQAYARYGRASASVFARVGGSIIWRGRMDAMVIGPAEQVWDAAFIARYPDASAFLAMVTDPEYRLAVVHRQAAVLTSRLVRFAPTTGERVGFA